MLLNRRIWDLAEADKAGGEWFAAYVDSIRANDPLAAIDPGALERFAHTFQSFVCPLGWAKDGTVVWRDVAVAIDCIYWMLEGRPLYAGTDLNGYGWQFQVDGRVTHPTFNRNKPDRSLTILRYRDKFTIPIGRGTLQEELYA